MIPLLADARLDPVETVAKTQSLIEREPLAFVAALGFVVACVALYLLLRAKDKHLLAQARASEIFERKFTEQAKQYADKLDELREAASERSIKLELMLHGFLELTDDFRFIAYEARKRAERRERPPKSGETRLPPTGGGT